MAVPTRSGWENFNMDYVYTKGGDGDFKTMHVEITVENERLHIVFGSDEDVSPEDMDNAVDYVNHSQISRMRVDIIDECDIYLNSGGRQRKLALVREGAREVKVAGFIGG